MVPKALLSAILALTAIGALSQGGGYPPSSLSPVELARVVSWYGQNSLRFEFGGKLIWIDPVNVGVTEKADLILITHDHQDHYSPADIARLSGPSTVVLVGFDGSGYPRIRPGERKVFGGLALEAVPAYNIKKAASHPKSKSYCGFVLEAGGLKLYDAGDTERIPEMASISCDVAFLPLGQTYTMDSVSEAAQAAIDVKAKIAVPVHFGMYEGTEADVTLFARLLAGKVEVLRLPRRN